MTCWVSMSFHWAHACLNVKKFEGSDQNKLVLGSRNVLVGRMSHWGKILILPVFYFPSSLKKWCGVSLCSSLLLTLKQTVEAVSSQLCLLGAHWGPAQSWHWHSWNFNFTMFMKIHNRTDHTLFAFFLTVKVWNMKYKQGRRSLKWQMLM